MSDLPECDLCGTSTCPDADQPEFSEPRACAYLPIYNALRYDRCEYGCARDVTKETIRRDIAPAVQKMLAAERERTAKAIEAVVADYSGSVNESLARGWIGGMTRAAEIARVGGE